MTCPDYKDLMMGFLDDELNEEQRQKLQDHLNHCPDCSSEMEEFKKLKTITENVALAEPEDRIWQQYWSGIYNRLERGLGWIVFSIGAIILLIYGGFHMIGQIIEDTTISTLIKIALLLLIAGVAILLVSVFRERLYFWKTDRYKDVRR